MVTENVKSQLCSELCHYRGTPLTTVVSEFRALRHFKSRVIRLCFYMCRIFSSAQSCVSLSAGHNFTNLTVRVEINCLFANLLTEIVLFINVFNFFFILVFFTREGIFIVDQHNH